MVGFCEHGNELSDLLNKGWEFSDHLNNYQLPQEDTCTTGFISSTLVYPLPLYIFTSSHNIQFHCIYIYFA
jgi:hypothetical protein